MPAPSRKSALVALADALDLEEQIARIRLIRTPLIGPVSFAQLITRFGNARDALREVPTLARRGGGRSPIIVERDIAEREMERVARFGAHYLFRGVGAYPRLLDQIETAPPLLIVKGDAGLAGGKIVAMVGARNASAAAMRFARQLAHQLGRAGVVVVSGLARGIDTEAHVGSIETGTIGVIAGGIDVVYPPENDRLQAAIAERGLLIAEQPPGLEPRARHFPHRNRLIAGLAMGVVVVEAAPKSGSLITARLANECGREVMAVPGSPLDPRAQGCNSLIRDGATLVQSADDILESLGPIDSRVGTVPLARYQTAPALNDASDVERRDILALLGPTPVPLDELVRLSGIAAGPMHSVLLELELAGRLARHAGGRVSLSS